MPTVAGYTRNEIISILSDMVGNNSVSFVNALKTGFSGWMLEFYNMHDWNFTLAGEVFFNSIIGGSQYNVLSLGFPEDFIFNSNIESMVCITPGGNRKLAKVTETQVRTWDPGEIAVGRPTVYYELGFNVFGLWPVPNIAERFKVSGKHEAPYIDDTSGNNSLQMPYKYQDCFLQYCFVKALRRERDPRAKEELMIFKEQLRIAITDDMRNLESNLRVQTANENFGSTGAYNLNYVLWNDGWGY